MWPSMPCLLVDFFFAQKLSELFDTDKQEKEEETPVEEDVGSPVQLTSEWEVGFQDHPLVL